MVSNVIRGLIPAIKEKVGFDCPNLGALARKITSIEAQFRYACFNKFQKVGNVGYDAGSCVLEQLTDESDEEMESDEIVAVDWVWKYFEYIPWTKKKSTEEEGKKFNFYITKAYKIFDYLLKKGQIKLTENHKIP